MGKASVGALWLAICCALGGVLSGQTDLASGTSTWEHLHGDEHPPVTINFDETPLWRLPGLTELTFHVKGTMPGFQYQIVAQISDDGVSWEGQEQIFTSEQLAAGQVRMTFPPTQAQDVRVNIEVLDMYAGLPAEEAVVGRRHRRIRIEGGTKPDDSGQSRSLALENNLHGENHPPVSIQFSSDPLVRCRDGRIVLTMGVFGAVPGFRYSIGVALNLQTVQVRERQFTAEELSGSVTMDFFGTVGETSILTELEILDLFPGLTAEQAILTKREYRLQLGTNTVPCANDNLPQIAARITQAESHAVSERSCASDAAAMEWSDVSMTLLLRTCAFPKCLDSYERDLRPSLLAFFPWRQVPLLVVLDHELQQEDGSEQKVHLFERRAPFASVAMSVREDDASVWIRGHERQQYTQFHADLYTDKDFVAFVDTDTLFVTPVTPGDIFDSCWRPIVVGQVCLIPAHTHT